MHSIGNESDAQTILRWVRSHSGEYGIPSCVEHNEAPEGWKYVGHGSFRSVWCSPEGVAYKVEHGTSGWSYQSETEVDNLKFAWEKGAPEGCRLPRFDEFVVDDTCVVAMELISGARLYDYGKTDGPFGDYYKLLGLIEQMAQPEHRMLAPVHGHFGCAEIGCGLFDIERRIVLAHRKLFRQLPRRANGQAWRR